MIFKCKDKRLAINPAYLIGAYKNKSSIMVTLLIDGTPNTIDCWFDNIDESDVFIHKIGKLIDDFNNGVEPVQYEFKVEEGRKVSGQEIADDKPPIPEVQDITILKCEQDIKSFDKDISWSFNKAIHHGQYIEFINCYAKYKGEHFGPMSFLIHQYYYMSMIRDLVEKVRSRVLTDVIPITPEILEEIINACSVPGYTFGAGPRKAIVTLELGACENIRDIKAAATGPCLGAYKDIISGILTGWNIVGK